MNFSYYLFERTTLRGQGLFGKLIVKIAIGGIAIGLATMLVSVAVVGGFQKTIPEEITGFWGSIQVTKLNPNSITDSQPIVQNAELSAQIAKIENVAHVQSFALKAAIAKTSQQFEGIVLKGIDSSFSTVFLKSKMVAGTVFRINAADSLPSNQILVSQLLANRLELHVGSRLPVYFIEQPPRMRAFTVAGIYNLGIEAELGKPIVIADLRQIQRLNGWAKNQIGGYEIYTKNLKNLNATTETVRDALPITENAQNIQELYPQLFSWLSLFDTNQKVIIGIMVLVAGINMVSALLILILEKTTTIGLLKALGLTNFGIKKMFFYTGTYLIAIGLLLGNGLGLLIIYAQKQTGFLKLPAQSYYVSEVPVYITSAQVFWLNVGSLMACATMLWVPLLVINKLSIVKTIQFKG